MLMCIHKNNLGKRAQVEDENSRRLDYDELLVLAYFHANNSFPWKYFKDNVTRENIQQMLVTLYHTTKQKTKLNNVFERRNWHFLKLQKTKKNYMKDIIDMVSKSQKKIICINLNLDAEIEYQRSHLICHNEIWAQL